MTTHPPELVDLVAETLAETALAGLEEGATPPASVLQEAAAELLDRIVGRAIGYVRHEDRTLTLQWDPDTAAVAVVARDLLESMVAEHNRVHASADYPGARDERIAPTPAQAWAHLLQWDPEERIRRLGGLLEAADRGHACWLADHVAQLDNLRSDVHVARAELADVRARTYTDHVLVVSDPDGVLTVPASTTDDALDQVRAVVPDGVAVERDPLCGECGAAHTTAEHIRSNLAPLTSASTVEELDREIAWIDKTIEAPWSEAYAETGRHLAAQLREQRDKLAAAERSAPWPDPEVAVDVIDHTDEQPAQ